MSRRKNSQQEQKQGQQWELPVGSKVWVYLRHSPGDNQTIESQQMGMRDWCAYNGWLIEHEFVDEGIEGSKEEREHFQEMLAHAKQTPRPIDGIAVWSFSRFARSQLDSQYYKADLRKRGYVVVSKIDDIPNNEMAPIFESVIDWKNQRFLEDLSVDVKRGLGYIAGLGYWPHAIPPTGYRFEREEIGKRKSGSMRFGKHLVKDEAISERVSLAWHMKLEQNASFRVIHDATHLFHRVQAYTGFFDNLIYAGIFEYQGKRLPLDWEDGSRFCEPYVTLEEFLQVQQNRQVRSLPFVAPRLLSSPYLLAGLLRCGLCEDNGRNERLCGGHDIRSSYRYYRCASRASYGNEHCNLAQIPCWRIDDAVVAYLKQTVLSRDYVREMSERARIEYAERDKTISSSLRQASLAVKESQKRVEAILEVISVKRMTPLLEKQYDIANSAWLEATARLNAFQADSVRSHAQRFPLADIQEHLDDILQALDSAPISERRSLIAKFVDNVLVYPQKIDVHFTFSLETFTNDIDHEYVTHSQATQWARSSFATSAIAGLSCVP